jgi:8-oxo-dGTP pyrophosphatase MutT (NUDIX family)
MIATPISLDAAKTEKLFYFVACVVVVRDDGRALILQRAKTEKVHPGKWGVIGGKLEWNDLPLDKPTRVQDGNVRDYLDIVEALLARETREEAGIEIGREFVYVNSAAYIRPDNVPSVSVKFAARYVSGEVVPEAGAFDGYAWVTPEEVTKFDCVAGIPEEVAQAVAALAAVRAVA